MYVCRSRRSWVDLSIFRSPNDAHANLTLLSIIKRCGTWKGEGIPQLLLDLVDFNTPYQFGVHTIDQ